jgi:hypothetical protein
MKKDVKGPFKGLSRVLLNAFSKAFKRCLKGFRRNLKGLKKGFDKSFGYPLKPC